jgi:hypothetical protein
MTKAHGMTALAIDWAGHPDHQTTTGDHVTRSAAASATPLVTRMTRSQPYTPSMHATKGSHQ